MEEVSPLKPVNTSKIRVKNYVAAIAGILFAVIGFFIYKQIFLSPPSFDTLLMQSAGELNKSCPIMVDEYTRLDNAVALPDNGFQYNYTLVSLEKSEVNADSVKKYIEPGIISNVKTNPDLQIYRDNKTTMVYYYKDKNGAFFLKISVTPDMYQ